MLRVSSLILALAALVCAVTARASQPAHATAIIFLDKSGSMKKTDPDCVRWEAVDLLLGLMQNEDRAALYTFGTDVERLTGNVVRLDDTVRRQLAELDSRCVARDAHTDVLAALRTAERVVADLGAAAREAYPPTVVVLTDGVDDVAEPRPDRREEIRRSLDALGSMGARIFAVGLSGGADRELLQEMKDRTDGEITLLEDPSDLLGSFFRFSRELAGRWLVWEGAVADSRLTIQVPAWAQEITAIYIPNRATERGEFATAGRAAAVVTPHYRLLKFTADGRHSVDIQLPPVPGHVIVDCSGDLVLAAPVPARIPFDVPFQMRMELRAGEGQEIAPASFLDHATARITWRDATGRSEHVFLYDDGMHGDAEAGDGVYGGRVMLHLQGEASYVAEVKAPYSRPVSAQGTTVMVGEPVAITPPGPAASILAGSGRSLQWRLANRTGAGVPVRIEQLRDGDVVARQSTVLPQGGEATAPQDVPLSWLKPQNVGIRFYVGEQTVPVFADDRTVWPIGWLALALLALLLLLLLSFLFPRRSAQGASLNVYHYRSADEEPAARTVRLAGNGPVVGVDVPAPFDDPGTFTAQSGMWRRGVKFRPAPGLVPRFSGHRPSRSRDGWIIRRTATWTVEHDGQSAKYTFKCPR